MSSDELSLVADHMGHSTNIHTTVYRLQQNIMERSKMARILVASMEGMASRDEPTQMERVSLDEILLEGMCECDIYAMILNRFIFKHALMVCASNATSR